MTFETGNLYPTERSVLEYFTDGIGTDPNNIPISATITRLFEVTWENTPANDRTDEFLAAMDALTNAPDIFLAAQDLRNALAGVP